MFEILHFAVRLRGRRNLGESGSLSLAQPGKLGDLARRELLKRGGWAGKIVKIPEPVQRSTL